MKFSETHFDKSSSQRVMSLDALRGFDMCWILGLAEIFEVLLHRFALGSPVQQFLSVQFSHADWEGFRFEDAIFPTFLFLSGVSLAFAVPRRLAASGRSGAVRHLLLRAVIIFVLGVIYSGGMKEGIHNVRWLGVIQRIGIASAAAGILSLWIGPRGLILTAASLLIGYWLMLAFIPVPGAGVGNFSEGMNLTNYLDKIWLPGRKYDGDHDPEGLLSTLPAIAHAILGLLAGQWLRRDLSVVRKTISMMIVGIALLALGWAWHPYFPVVKKLWSSSFVLVSSGVSLLALTLFYWIIDVREKKTWCTPFLWIGANPLTLYLMEGLGFFEILNRRIVGEVKGEWAWVTQITLFALILLTARFLYRRGIFLRA